MSHFVTLVILPKGTAMEQVASRTTFLLQPYDEETRVLRPETECWCLGIQARIEVENEVNAKFDIKQLRDQFLNLPKTKRTDAKWAELLAPRTKLQDRLLSKHPLKDSAQPSCKSCHGTGKQSSEYNPKWDWWVIGSRWDGWIFGPEREKAAQDGKGGFNFGDEHERVENNCRRVSQIPIEDPHYVPFAVLTPESQWVETGEMGSWATVTNAVSDEMWHQTVQAVLSKYPDHLAVAVDCHT